jgi:hypothetical protein
MWDNSHMSNKCARLKCKEVRIRHLTPVEHKRIGLAAKEQDLSASCFCLYAALDRCDKHDAAKRRTPKEPR